MSNELAIVKKNVIDVVQQKVNGFVHTGELQLPSDYSPDNALKSAFLILQDTVNRDKKPVLTACTQNSIANSLLNMIVQGLNPEKKQCYFIAYGASLACQRSYFGNMALAKRVNPDIGDIVAEVVYEKDKLIYKINKGKRDIVGHEQELENIDKDKIKAAYCIVLDHNGEVMHTELMTIAQIHQAWKQSKMNPFENNGKLKANSTHSNFTEDMCKKTVISKACKPIINSSSDNAILSRSITETGDDVAERLPEIEYRESANKEPIDIEMSPVPENVNPETGEITEPESGPTSAEIDAQLAKQEEEAPY
jgi:recombination protein RecT